MNHRYLFTDVDNTQDNVMIFTRIPLSVLQQAFQSRGITWTDAFPVDVDEMQFYLFEPMYLTEDQEKAAYIIAEKSASEMESVE